MSLDWNRKTANNNKTTHETIIWSDFFWLNIRSHSKLFSADLFVLNRSTTAVMFLQRLQNTSVVRKESNISPNTIIIHGRAIPWAIAPIAPMTISKISTPVAYLNCKNKQIIFNHTLSNYGHSGSIQDNTSQAPESYCTCRSIALGAVTILTNWTVSSWRSTAAHYQSAASWLKGCAVW